MDNKTYWQKRAVKSLVESEKLANKQIELVLPIYNQALKDINIEIQSIYDNYAVKGILTKSDLNKALNPSERRRFLRLISRKATVLGINPNEVFDVRYLSRLTRSLAIKYQIIASIMAIAPEVNDLADKSNMDIIKRAYKASQKDLKLLGANASYSTINKTIADKVLSSKWERGNYSSRIWKNLDEFSDELPKIIGGSLTSGQSYQQTANLLRKRFSVSKNDATRLVRTETNYLHNQAELQSYLDDGLEEYNYDSVMDSRTSSICRGLNNKVFKMSEATVGVNYPPTHPNCRSTTNPIIKFTRNPDTNNTTRLRPVRDAFDQLSVYTPIIISKLTE